MDQETRRILQVFLTVIAVMLGVGATALASVPHITPARSEASPRSEALRVTPHDVHYGRRQVGDVSSPVIFVVKNTTRSTLELWTTNLYRGDLINPGRNPDFTIQLDDCDGETLRPRESCSVMVAFSPKSPGIHKGWLHISGYVPDGPLYNGWAKMAGVGFIKEVTKAGARNAGQIGDPDSTSIGEYHFEKRLFDLGGPLPLQLTLYYASWMRMGKVGGYNDPFGGDWSHNYHLALALGPTDTLTIQYGPGDLIQFHKSGGQWQVSEEEEVVYQLREDADHYYLMDPIREWVYTFEKHTNQSFGILTHIEDRNGNALAFTNDDEGRILRVEDMLGRSLDFTYSPPLLPWIDPQLVQVTDQAGRTIQFGYGDWWGGNLTVVTDTMGLGTTFPRTGTITDSVVIAQTLPKGNTPYQQTYERDPLDWGWRLVSQTDAYGHALTLDFNDALNVTTVTDPLGDIQQHTHQDQRLLTEQRDEAGQSTSFGYDAHGRRTAITNRLGNTTQIVYHPETGKITSSTDAEGHTTTYNYTAQNQTFTLAGAAVTFTFYNLARITHPDGSHEDFVHDAHGNVTTYTDQAGQTWQYRYNTRGRVTQITNPTGGVVDYTYHADGSLASATESGVGVITYAYDAYKRLATVSRPDGSTVHLTYDLNDRLLSITDELGRTTTFAYDANGNWVAETNPLGQTTAYAYDLMDRLTNHIDPAGHARTYRYDAGGRPASFADPNGHTTTYTYNPRGWLTGLTNPAGHTRTQTYDEEGVLTSRTTPLGFITAYQTDRLGRNTAVIDPLGAVTHYAYDALGRQTSITDRVGRTTTYAYDGEGRLTGTSQSGLGAAIYTYNGLGMLTRITDLRGKHWDFGYSSMGRRTSHTDPLGNQWQYAYDDRGRLRQVTYPGSSGTATHTCDATGQVTQIAYSSGPTLNYTYDAAGRLLTANHLALTDDVRGDITKSQDGTTSFGATYDPGRRLKAITYSGLATVTYTYDSRNLLTRVEDDLSGAWVALTYDDDGRLTQIQRSNGVNTTFAYDAAGRVIRIQDGTLADQQYTLNAEGEPIQVARTLPFDPPPVGQVGNWSYNDAGQISSPGYAYDARGRQTAAAARTFTYDGGDRVTQVVSGTATVDFTYNGLGDLRTRTANGVTTTYYHYYALVLAPIVAEKEGTAYKRLYVYTPGGALLYSIDVATSQVRFYHFDRIGSTLFLTNDTGAVSDAYAYDPYGNMLGRTGTSDQPFTYVGQYGVRWEPVGNLYDMRARYYDPATARFLTRDPVWPVLDDPLSLNPYQYAAQNPLRYVDPAGTSRGTTVINVLEQTKKRLEEIDRQRTKILFDTLTGNKIPRSRVDPDWSNEYNRRVVELIGVSSLLRLYMPEEQLRELDRQRRLNREAMERMERGEIPRTIAVPTGSGRWPRPAK